MLLELCLTKGEEAELQSRKTKKIVQGLFGKKVSLRILPDGTVYLTPGHESRSFAIIEVAEQYFEIERAGKFSYESIRLHDSYLQEFAELESFIPEELAQKLFIHTDDLHSLLE